MNHHADAGTAEKAAARGINAPQRSELIKHPRRSDHEIGRFAGSHAPAHFRHRRKLDFNLVTAVIFKGGGHTRDAAFNGAGADYFQSVHA